MERLAPHSVEAEEAVLGAIMLNQDRLIDLNFLTPEHFYILRHIWIWQAMQAINNRGEAIDNLTLMEELRNQGHLDEVGGGAYISHLINNTPTSLHAEVYARIVERAAERRVWLRILAPDDAVDVIQEFDEDERPQLLSLLDDATRGFPVIVVDEHVDVHDYDQVFFHVCANVDPKRDVVLTEGPLDQLDHAAVLPCYGGKLGIDATAKTFRTWGASVRAAELARGGDAEVEL